MLVSGDNGLLTESHHEIDVGIVIPYSIYGGGEVYLKNIISKFDTQPYNFHFIYMKPNKLEGNICKNKNIFSHKAQNTLQISKIIKSKNIKIGYIL